MIACIGVAPGQNMFDEQFETVIADTESSKAIHYKLRYQIYCLERRFESPGAFSDQQETDIYDKNSVHFIVRHRDSGQWVGAMRLVLAIPTKLPLTRVSIIDTDSIQDHKGAVVAEASRLCVLPSRQWGTTERLDIVHPSIVTLALIRAAREYNLTHNIQFSYFLITSQLARILGRVGIEITAVGPITHYRGVRRPYLHDCKNGYKAMRDKSPHIYTMFLESPAYKYYSNTYVQTLHQPRIQLFF
jgi:N-acyl amino acid synthase of PEP-CTERM/exosortase system